MSFWFDAESAMLLHHCGETTVSPIPKMLPFIVNKDNKLSSALNADATWAHDANHTHYLTLDLGKPHYITNLRGVLNVTTNIRHVVFYVSNSLTDYGAAVLDVEDWQAYSKEDADPWEYQMCTPKVGRYVQAQILSTTHASNYLRWG